MGLKQYVTKTKVDMNKSLGEMERVSKDYVKGNISFNEFKNQADEIINKYSNVTDGYEFRKFGLLHCYLANIHQFPLTQENNLGVEKLIQLTKQDAENLLMILNEEVSFKEIIGKRKPGFFINVDYYNEINKELGTKLCNDILNSDDNFYYIFDLKGEL